MSKQLKNNICDSPSCSCGHANESAMHFFLDVHPTQHRTKLLTTVNNILSPGSDPYMPLQIDQKYVLNVLLNGCPDLAIKANIRRVYAV